MLALPDPQCSLTALLLFLLAEGYIAHLAWAAAWMCKYDSSYCSTAEKWFNNALGVNNLRYGLGYDWDSTLPGTAALVISLGLPSASAAKQYLEDYVLTKWEVSIARALGVGCMCLLHSKESFHSTPLAQ